jgi:hypothetical protein
MGFSTTDQAPVDDYGNVLGTPRPLVDNYINNPAGSFGQPGMADNYINNPAGSFGQPGMVDNPPMLRGGPAAYTEDLQVPGMGSPGTGGKGGVASDPSMVVSPQMNIPQPTPMNPPQTGLPGLPVPVAPMTPLGPGLGNPGGPGVAPQQRMAPPPPMPPTFNTAKPMMRGGPARPIFDQMNRNQGQMNQNKMPQGRGAQPARPGSMARPQPGRGAGRGGMIR